MKTEILERTGNQIKADLTDIAEAARDISVKVKDGWNDTREDVQRAVRKAKAATEEGLAETRQRIKANPLASVTAVAGGAFVLGLLTGWVVARKRK
jgi:ElaB/YqjD/DUF883 family membrane-anchored ribosome-binding protein